MSGFGLIYKWLSGVDHEPIDPAHPAPDKQTETQNTQRAADKSTERRRTTDEKYSARFLSLEPTNAVSPAPANLPSQVNKYERRPRHKTKPDRYEYKDSSRADGKESRKRHASKLKRKHMVNGDFHASNVAQSRLTLQNGRNLGIFQKGKTSTPVKSGELPDLAFSEMKFLSKQPQSGYKEAMPKYRERKMEGNKGKESQKRPDYSTRFETHPVPTVPTPMSIQAANPFSSQVAGSDLPRNSSPIDNLSLYQPYHGECAPEEHLSNHKDKNSENQRRPHPRSASFYTWSESNRSNSNDLFEFCLAKILPADLTKSINAPTANIDPNKQYLDVEQLKELLKDRKRSCESEFAHSDAASGRHPKRKRRLPAPEDRPHSKDSGRHRIPTLGKFMMDNRRLESNRRTLPESPPLPYSNPCRVLYPNNSTYNRVQEEQTGRQNDANLEFLRQELKHPDTHGNDLNRDSYRQQRQPLDLSEARSLILDSEMQWINTLDPSRLTNGAHEVENEQLFIQSLDDAYNRILNRGGPRYAQEDILGDESSLNPEARGVTAEWTHGLGRNANEPQSRMSEPSGPNSGGKCWPSSIHRPIPGTFSQEPRGESLAAARPSPLGMWEAVNEPKRAATSYPCVEMAGFWRRNKLY